MVSAAHAVSAAPVAPVVSAVCAAPVVSAASAASVASEVSATPVVSAAKEVTWIGHYCSNTLHNLMLMIICIIWHNLA